jgi:16S rRNA (guanine966-N2)-methyltransferase
MRVIAGQLRSRKLHAPKGAQTRPTHDRVKEALFSVLGNVVDFNVLDLYAGTGALGIEALSRGARHACFVEQARGALESLRRNLSELSLTDQATVLARDVRLCAAELMRIGPFDLVFCDPPWQQMDAVVTQLSALAPPTWLSPEGKLVLEHSARWEARGIDGLCPSESRRWGDTAVTVFGLCCEEVKPG